MGDFWGNSKVEDETVLAESLNELFQRDFAEKIGIAEEGMLGNMMHTIDRVFTKRKTMVNDLNDALDNLKTKGSKKDYIVDPSWGAQLSFNYNGKVKANNIISDIKKLTSFCDSKEISVLIKDCSDILTAFKKEIDKSTFFSDKEDVENIFKLSDKVTKTVDKVNSLFDKNVKGNKGDDLEFEPLSYNAAKSISDIIKTKLINEHTAEWDKFERVAIDYNNTIMSKTFKRMLLGAFTVGALIGTIATMFSSDTRTAGQLVEKLNQAIIKILMLQNRIYKTSFAFVKYVEDSAP